MQETAHLVARNCRWECDGLPFFAGEEDCCINAGTIVIGSYLGVDVDPVVQRLVAAQMPDGGLELLGPDAPSTGILRKHPGRDRRLADVGAPYRRFRCGPPGTPEWGRSTCYGAASSGRYARARWSTPGGPCSPTPHAGTTTCLRPLSTRPAWGHSGSAAGRSRRTRPRQAPTRRALAAREHPPRRGPLPVRGTRRRAQPMEHLAGALRVLRWYDASAHRAA